MDRAEVVVVGGGHNGLVCACYLARAGLDVVVLEAADTPGGCIHTVELPGGERMRGRVSSVGTVARAAGRDEEDGETVIDVEITLRGRPKTRLDRAPVEVELVSERVEDVLTVPVEALLALREGGQS